MSKIITLSFLSLGVLISPLRASIVESPDLHPFEKALESANEHALILFDVDDTLISAKDSLLRPSARGVWDRLAKSSLDNPEIPLTRKYDRDYYFSLVLSRLEYELVDPHVVDIIKNLQRRQIKAIAFTKMMTGSFGAIPSMEDWRLSQLLKEQIDFSKAFPDNPLLFLKAQVGNVNSVFKNGVLCANRQNKGPVLISFLNRLEWKPQKVVFIDNRRDYLESVEKSLEGTGIEFLGFYYTAAEKNPRAVNEKLAKFQMMHLAKFGVWLTDAEALEVILSAALLYGNL